MLKPTTATFYATALLYGDGRSVFHTDEVEKIGRALAPRFGHVAAITGTFRCMFLRTHRDCVVIDDGYRTFIPRALENKFGPSWREHFERALGHRWRELLPTVLPFPETEQPKGSPVLDRTHDSKLVPPQGYTYPEFNLSLPALPVGGLHPVPAKYQRIETQTVLMTPPWAKAILESQDTPNRRTVKKNLEKIKRAMLERTVKDRHTGLTIASAWEVNGETLIFDCKGIRKEGFHRLLACVETGISFYTRLTVGVSDDNQIMMTIDTGKSRTPGDYFDLAGEAHGHGLAAAINTLELYRRQHAGRAGNTTGAALDMGQGLDTARMSAVNEAHPALRQSVDLVGRITKKTASPAHLSVVHYLATLAGYKAEGDAFVDGMKTGANLPKDSPILAYLKLSSQGKFHSNGARFWTLVEAFNRYFRSLQKSSVAGDRSGRGLLLAGSSHGASFGKPSLLCGVKPDRLDVTQPPVLIRKKPAD